MKKGPLHIKSFSSQRGFSLVELLVAFAIFVMFVTSILRLTTDSSIQVRHSINNERAALLAEEIVEASRNIRDFDFDSLTDGLHGISTSSNIFNYSGSSDDTSVFNRQVSISTISPDLKQLDVTITWGDQANPNNSFSLSTYLSNWRKYVPPAGLTVKKVVINYFSSKNIDDFAPYEVQTTIGTTTITNTLDTGTAIEFPPNTYTFGTLTLAPSTYTVSETPDSDYTATFSGDCNSSGHVTMLASSSKVCTITNEEKYASLTVNKVVTNTHGGTKVISDFIPYAVGSTTVIQGVSTKFPAGTYTVSEATDPGYTPTFSGDCNSSGVVSLAIGQSKTCTITNVDDLVVAPTLSTPTSASISTSTATLGATVTSLGIPATLTARGVCYRTTPGPTLVNGATCVTATLAQTLTAYTVGVTGLTPGTTYYFAGYATNSTGTGYSADGTFTTSVLAVAPTVTTTSPITSITQTTASGGGNVTSDGGASVTVRGVVWDTAINPTTALSTKTSDGTGTGSFTSSITSLTCNTLYHVRAYATNSVGTSYGSDVTFTTSACNAIPTLSTPTSASISTSTATLGATVTSLGIPATLTARGVCYRTTPGPTLVNGATCVTATLAQTLTAYTVDVTGLTPGTTYYFAGYATNSTGTGYSADGTFATIGGACVATGITPTTSDQSSGTTNVVSKPTGVAQNDLMFAYIGHENASDVLTTIPSGWTQVGRNHNVNANEALYYKVAGASEPTTYTFGFSSSVRSGITINAYRGCFNTSTAVDVISNTQYVVSNTTYRAASMTLPSPYTTIILFPSVVTTGNKSFTAPTTQGGGWTTDYNFGNASSRFSRSAFSKLITASGATGVMDSIGTYSGTTKKHAFAVGLKPL